jgi:hypothetical protein
VAAVVGNLLILAYLIHRLLLDARFKAQQLGAGPKPDKLTPIAPAARSRPVVNEVP